MDITATNDFKNQSYSGIKKHVQHDPKLNHSNDDIKPEFTKYNRSEILLDYHMMDDIKMDMFLDDCLEYNEKQIKSRHKSNFKNNLDEYIQMKTRKKNWDKCLVSTFGNKKDQDELLNGLNDDEIAYVLKKQSHALSEFARDFNRRNKYLKIERYTTNVDESTPHLHAQVIPLGRTKKGKASLSLNSALSAEYKYKTGHELKDSRQILSWFRNSEDNILTSFMSKEFKHDLNEDYQLKRTGEHVDNFDSYKKIKASLDEKQNSLDQEQKMLIVQKKGDQIHEMNLKHHSLKLLKDMDPEHLTDDENAEPIRTPIGKKQHTSKSVSTVFDYVFDSLKKFKKREEKIVQGFKNDFKKISTSVFKFANEHYDNQLSEEDISKLSEMKSEKVEVDFSGSHKVKISPIDAVIKTLNRSFDNLKKSTDNNKLRSKELDEREHNLDIREQKLNGYGIDFDKHSHNIKKPKNSYNPEGLNKLQQMADDSKNAIFNQSVSKKENELTVDEKIDLSMKRDMLDDFNERQKRQQKNHRSGPHMHM